MSTSKQKNKINDPKSLWPRLMRLLRKDSTTTHAPRTLARKTKLLYSDDPDSLNCDILNRKRLAAQLGNNIRDLAETTESAVVALVGPWGSGKSTLLGQIEKNLAGHDWYIGRHNPWAYADFAGAAAGFFASLRDAVPEDVLGKEWRETVGNWISRSAPLGAVGGIAGVDGSGMIGTVGAIITGDRSPARLRESAADGLAKIDRPVLMVLDDLDRLAPDELLYTFKLVRFLGRLPNVYYLLAYDEATLTDVLEATDLVVKSKGRAQQYLEKIIQVRLDIPPMLPEQQSKLATAAHNELCKRQKIELSSGNNHRIQQIWTDCLSIYLDQPRSLKRLFTHVDAMWSDVAGEVDFSDFLAITFLRVFEHRVFDLIIEYRDELLEQTSTLTIEPLKESLQDRRKRWKQRIADANPQHPEAIEALLAHLFLYIRGGRESTVYDGSYREDIRQRMGVGTSEHFDRYIQVGVPESDLPEATVRAAAAELRSGESGGALEKLVRHMRENFRVALPKLHREHLSSSLPAASTLPLLRDLYLPAMDQKTGPFELPPNSAIRNLAMDVLDKTEPSTAAALVVQTARSDTGGLALTTDVVISAQNNSDTQHPWAVNAKKAVTEALTERIWKFASQPAQSHPHLLRYLYNHFLLAGSAETHELLWTIIDSDKWELREVLGLLIPLGQARSSENTWTAMGEFSESVFEDLLGVDKVLDRIPERPDLLARQIQNSYFDRQVDANDLEARIEYALTGLEHVRARRAQEMATANAEPAPIVDEEEETDSGT